MVSLPGFGLQHLGFKSGRNLSRILLIAKALDYTESFIIFFMLYQYDLNTCTVERNVKPPP